MELKDEKLSIDDFLEIRKEVLETWSTGKEVENLEKNLEYTSAIPDYKNFAKKLEFAVNNNITMTQPRAGVALIEQQITLLKYLQKHGECDFLPTTIDSYTRQNKYLDCETGIIESLRLGRSMLNGFPAVNFGVHGCKRVQEAVNLPIQARHGTPDSRLLAEIIHAAGWTSNEGGGISYNIPYSKNVSLEKSLRDWQYCDRLAGFYQENGVAINREPFGPLTGTMVPPSMSNAIAIIEALLANTQGVKSITVGYGQCGNLIQDVAAIWSLRSQTEKYLRDRNADDCVISTVLHQWMGGFPMNEARAYAVINNASVTAALSGVTKVIVKTTHEAHGIPTKEANAAGLRSTKMVLRLLEGQQMVDSPSLQEEIEVINKETDCILKAVFEIGKGDLAVGVVEAFKAGILDIPFAPSVHCANKLMPARDNNGAVRYLDLGNIPFTKELRDYNRSKLDERASYENRPIDFSMTVDDIFAVSRGNLIGRRSVNNENK